jgi:hypothetical protein
LIREARARQRKRWAGAVALVAALAGVALAVFSIIGGTTRSTSHGGSQRSGASTASRCGVQVKGVRIFQGRRLVYREPVSRTLGHQIECSGSTVWVVFFNGVGSSQEAYFGVRSGDSGRSWKAVFAERYFKVKAPHELVTGYLGPWTLDGPRAAYFVGDCVACGAGTVSLWVTEDGGRTFRRYAVSWPKSTKWTPVRVTGHTVTISAHHVQVS